MLAAACGGGGSTGSRADAAPDTANDAVATDHGESVDAAVDAAGEAAPEAARDAGPEGKASAIDPKDVIARLTGDKPITGSTVITDRGTAANRAAARDYLLSVFASIGLPGKLHSYTTTGRGPGDNVYAELPATGPGAEWVVLGAHYDTPPGVPGANDDATGVVVVLSVAEQMAAMADRSRWRAREHSRRLRYSLSDWGRWESECNCSKTTL